MTTHGHDGGCLCGRVRFRMTGTPLDSGYCHCRMCQRSSGAPVVAWVTFETSGFRWTGAEPRSYASSTCCTRHFCETCGSYLVFKNSESPAEISINTACFDHPAEFPPRKHIFVENRIAWFATADDLPAHSGYGYGDGDSD